jgi:serpin B
VNDLEEIENNLIREKMDPSFKQLQKQKVKIFVPRFEITDQFNVEGILKRLGMIDAFDRNRADFSGMTEKENLQIDSIIHKAFVEVDEEGTEAAAATITSFIGMGLPKKPKPIPVFRADHPFLIFIRDLETKSILFMGRVMNPKLNVNF